MASDLERTLAGDGFAKQLLGMERIAFVGSGRPFDSGNESKYSGYPETSEMSGIFLRWKNKNEADLHRRDQREDVDHRKRGCPRGEYFK